MSAGRHATRGDLARQWVTVVGAVAQAALPAIILPRLRRDLEPPDVAQPAPWAFAIWLPVYAASGIHAARQARPVLHTDPVLRDAGWPLAAAYVCIGGWAPLLRRRHYWAAQGALTGAAVLAGTARVRLDSSEEQTVPWSLALSTGLLSGWGAAASGINWPPWWSVSGPSRPDVRRLWSASPPPLRWGAWHPPPCPAGPPP